jgi:phosphoribosyl 1,2-cyclic phosphodiesterase
MALYISSLNSGSNGNCYYIGNNQDAVLVDVGISCREVERRMFRLGLSMQKLKAIFISHEHTDHIKGLTNFAKKFKLPIYITDPTLKNSQLMLDAQLIQPFVHQQKVQIGSLVVTPFSKHHDAVDPYSFMISDGDVNIGVFTDLGIPCAQLIHHFQQCHAAFLEANYDEDMLENGGYPYHLKRRIRGGKGHLSNHQALDVFRKYRPPFMTHLLLSHLSQHNNCPKLVENLFSQYANSVKITVASRFEETPVFEITNNKHRMAFIGRQMELDFEA